MTKSDGSLDVVELAKKQAADLRKSEGDHGVILVLNCLKPRYPV